MKLLCVCELITRIDFWALLLTGISTIAVIVIAVIQIKMQKQQTKIQEYEFYKDAYTLIRSIHETTNSFIYTIAYTISNESILLNFEKEFLSNKKQKLDNISKKLSESQNELASIANLTNLQYANYIMLLIYMRTIVDNIVYYINTDSIKQNKKRDIKLKDDKASIQYILECVSDENRAEIKKYFDYFIDSKKTISEYTILATLEKHCTLYKS